MARIASANRCINVSRWGKVQSKYEQLYSAENKEGVGGGEVSFLPTLNDLETSEIDWGFHSF